MADIVDLDARRAHTASVASCMACWHEWAAVVPVGTDLLECPRCGKDLGVKFTAREMRLIRALEQIKTGRSGEGAGWDVAAMRQIAEDALRRAEWPPQT